MELNAGPAHSRCSTNCWLNGHHAKVILIAHMANMNFLETCGVMELKALCGHRPKPPDATTVVTYVTVLNPARGHRLPS